MVIRTTDALNIPDVSKTEYVDLKSPGAKTLISQLFSFCAPKKRSMIISEEDEDDTSDDEPDDVFCQSLSFEAEVTPKIEKIEGKLVSDKEKEIEEEAKEGPNKNPRLFDGGIMLQLGLIGTILAIDKLI